MKKIPKKKLDQILDMTREYWDINKELNEELLHERIRLAQEFRVVGWGSLINLVDAILPHDGFCPEATNELVYYTIRLLGWEVVDDEEYSPE